MSSSQPNPQAEQQNPPSMTPTRQIPVSLCRSRFNLCGCLFNPFGWLSGKPHPRIPTEESAVTPPATNATPKKTTATPPATTATPQATAASPQATIGTPQTTAATPQTTTSTPQTTAATPQTTTSTPHATPATPQTTTATPQTTTATPQTTTATPQTTTATPQTTTATPQTTTATPQTTTATPQTTTATPQTTTATPQTTTVSLAESSESSEDRNEARTVDGQHNGEAASQARFARRLAKYQAAQKEAIKKFLACAEEEVRRYSNWLIRRREDRSERGAFDEELIEEHRNHADGNNNNNNNTPGELGVDLTSHLARSMKRIVQQANGAYNNMNCVACLNSLAEMMRLCACLHCGNVVLCGSCLDVIDSDRNYDEEDEFKCPLCRCLWSPLLQGNVYGNMSLLKIRF